MQGRNPDRQSELLQTSYNTLATLVQIIGEDKAFDYLAKLAPTSPGTNLAPRL